MTSRVPPDRLFRASRTLHRSTMELSLAVAELDAAMSRDDTTRFRHALAGQQRIRIGGIIALTIGTIFLRGADLAAIGAAIAIAGVYLVIALRWASVARQTEGNIRKRAALFAAVDAFAVTSLCSLAAAGGQSEALVWILMVGAVAAPGVTYGFGHKPGIVAFALFGGAYLATEVLFMGFGWGSRNPMVPVATVTLWAAGVWVLVRHFGAVRRRLDSLRTYAKLAEVGDVGTSDLLTETSASDDDFAMIARSLDAVHAKLSDQIGTDPLTGCANRRGLERHLLGVCRMAKRRDGIVAVLAMDIDFFKKINDTHGHPEGDRVLRQLATIMMNTARETDTVARLGGDEFVVILPDSDLRGARAFAERLRARVAEAMFGAPGQGIPVTLSIGVAVGQAKEELEPDLLLSLADQALYDAKSGGRNRVAARA